MCLLHTKEHNNCIKKIDIHLGIWVSRRSWHTFLAMRIWLRCMCLLYTKDRVTVYKPYSHLGVFPNVFIYVIHPASTMDAMHTIGHIPVHLFNNNFSISKYRIEKLFVLSFGNSILYRYTSYLFIANDIKWPHD
jgi:hypothetical protein